MNGASQEPSQVDGGRVVKAGILEESAFAGAKPRKAKFKFRLRGGGLGGGWTVNG